MFFANVARRTTKPGIHSGSTGGGVPFFQTAFEGDALASCKAGFVARPALPTPTAYTNAYPKSGTGNGRPKEELLGRIFAVLVAAPVGRMGLQIVRATAAA